MSEGLFYPNIWGRSILVSTEEILGKDRVDVVLYLTNLQHYIGNYPPLTIKKEFPFEHVARFQQGLYDLYGPRRARVLEIRGGEYIFRYSLSKYALMRKAAKAATSIGLAEMRFRLALQFFAKFFNAVSDQIVRVAEDQTNLYWIIDRCPICWGRTADEPICYLGIGLLRAISSWIIGGKQIRITETECQAVGGEACIFTIDKTF